jgi:hypothetical protein
VSGGYLRPFAVSLSCIVVAIAGLLLADRPAFPAPALFRIGVVLAVMLIGALPRLSIAADGLAAADYRVRLAGVSAPAEMALRLRNARQALGATVVGVGAAAAGWASWLALHGTPGDRLLALLAGLCLLVRSRLFEGTWAALVLLLTGLVVLALAGARLVTWHGSLPELAPTIAGMVTGAVLGTVQAALSWHGSPRRRLLRWVEATAVIAMVCVAAVSLGLVSAARAVIG